MARSTQSDGVTRCAKFGTTRCLNAHSTIGMIVPGGHPESEGRCCMMCPHCANDIPDGSKFCNQCGTPPQAQLGTRNTKSAKSGLMFLAGLAVAGIIAGAVY